MIRLALVLALLAPMALAEGRVMLGAHEQKAWQAVGRLNFGDGFCTGALVAPDLVVTAAHCLFAPRTGRARPVDRIHFVAGYRMRRFVGHQKAAEARAHPGFAFARELNAEDMARDLALITLEGPIEGAAPFALAPGLAAGDEVSILSYGRDRPEIPSIQSPCAVRRRIGAVAVLACDVTFGVSGAPVFREVDGERKIVAVISAMGVSQGEKVAFAVVLEASLPALLATP